MPLTSCACTQRQLESEPFQHWLPALGEPPRLHRKLWEWCYIAEALRERGMLGPGRRGLGFAVGTEPLVAAFANLGCTILASDLHADDAVQGNWIATDQHADGVQALNRRGLCPPEEFARRVSFRAVDMRNLPQDLGTFDFVWSSCSIEHLGSISAGIRFIHEMTRCLRPGGVAVHTTEFNVESDDATLDSGQDVIFRRRDLLAMKAILEAGGHTVSPLDFHTGDGPADAVVDEPPYEGLPHLKLRLGGFVSTSFGLICTAGPLPKWPRRRRVRKMLELLGC